MDKEKVFEFAREHGWHRDLRIMENDHSSASIASKLNKKERAFLMECRVMVALGLLQLVEKDSGGYAYVMTDLGMEFLKKYNA